MGLWTTLRDTGARLSEIVYLAVGDVDLQNKSVAIRPNAFRGNLKIASSERTIPLSDKALSALQVLRQGKGDGNLSSLGMLTLVVLTVHPRC